MIDQAQYLIESTLTIEDKRQIMEDLAVYINDVAGGSQNKASKLLNKVSSAYISHVMKGEDGGGWHHLSDDAWRRIQKQVGGDYSGEWNVIHTANYDKMQFFYAEARKYAMTFGIVSNAGYGKTASAMEDGTKNTFHFKCNQYLNRKHFLIQLLQSMGKSDDGRTMQDIFEMIVDEITKMDHPLIILDEFDKLVDSVRYFFISLYNALEGKCGFVIFGAPNLQTEIVKGAAKNKKGYEEILSRIGGKFIVLDPPTEDDMRAVIHANGVTTHSSVTRIVNDSNNDYRRVRRLVHAEKKKKGEKV